MASASMKDIKRRMKSVESTMKITKAMELVASSKLRRAKERAEQNREFFTTLYETMSEIATTTKQFDSQYTHARPVKTSCCVVIAGERGLAGGYNANVLKAADAQMEGKHARVIAIGKKAAEHYQRSTHRMIGSYVGVCEGMTLPDTYEMANAILALYRKGKIDELYVAYTNFVTALNQEPAVLKLLPIDFGGTEERSRDLVEYDPSPQAVFDEIVPMFLAGMLYGAVVESFASEQGARRTAMESASENASELVDRLGLLYNRARQSTITQEITEIVGGAQALE